MPRTRDTIASAEALLHLATPPVPDSQTSPIRYDTQADGGPHPLIRQLFALQAQVQGLAYQVDAALVMAQHALDGLGEPSATGPVPLPNNDGYKTFES